MFWKKKETKSKYSTDLIKKWEGCKLTAYKCPAGKWTIGYGNTTYEDGTPVKEGDKITQDRAERLLDNYLEKNVYWLFEGKGFTKGQIEALSSLVYNVGWAKVRASKCWKGILAQNWAEVFANWNWISANKKTLKGLIKRRSEELALFMKDI